MATVAHLVIWGTGGGGHEGGLPARREEDASETSQDGLLIENGQPSTTCEELKEGVWLEPAQAVLRRKTSESWTDKHRKVRKWVAEGGCVPLSVVKCGQKPDPRE